MCVCSVRDMFIFALNILDSMNALWFPDKQNKAVHAFCFC